MTKWWDFVVVHFDSNPRMPTCSFYLSSMLNFGPFSRSLGMCFETTVSLTLLYLGTDLPENRTFKNQFTFLSLNHNAMACK